MSIYELVCRFKKKYPMTVAWRLEAHSKLAEDVLDNDEELRYVFTAQKNMSRQDVMSTNVILITTKRTYFVHDRIIPGNFVTTIKNSMINDINAKNGLIWGSLIIDSVKEEIVLSNIDRNSIPGILEAFNDVLDKEIKTKKY